MLNQLEKSAIVIQKEQQLIELKKQKKKTLAQLKRNKKILNKLQKDILKLQHKISSGTSFNLMIKMVELKQEIRDCLKTIYESDKISAKEKDSLEGLMKAFQEEDEVEEQSNEETDEFDRKRAFDIFKEFQVAPEEKDQKSIRKTYIRLAARFHPDKSKSEREREQFHQLMLQINTAYERADLAELLAIKEQYSTVQTLAELDIEQECEMVDFLDIEIDKQNQEVFLLKNQAQRLKQELRQLRNSDLGIMVKQERDAKRYGYSFIDEQIEQAKKEYESMLEVRDELKKYAKIGILTNAIKNHFNQETTTYYPLEDEDWDLDEQVFSSSSAERQTEPNKRTRRRRKKKKK